MGCGKPKRLKEKKIMLNPHIFLLRHVVGLHNEEKNCKSITSLFDNILHDISTARLAGKTGIILMELL